MYTKQRRSILVRAAGSQEGPKNPLKGISVKSLVPALDAQSGVGAGGNGGAMQTPLRLQGAFQWHGKSVPVVVETCFCASSLLPFVVRCWYGSGLNLQCGADLDAVCRVACLDVAGADRGSAWAATAMDAWESPLEIPVAKEAKEPVRLLVENT